MKRPTKVEKKTIVMSYENLEAAVVSFLYSVGSIPDSWDVLSTDIPLQLNEDGFVEFDMEIGKPIRRPNLKVVDDKYIEQDNQLTLPLEHFEKINVVE